MTPNNNNHTMSGLDDSFSIPPFGKLLDQINLFERIETFIRVDEERILVIQGMRGLGKTNAAAKATHQYRDHFEDTFWMRSRPGHAIFDVTLGALASFFSQRGSPELMSEWKDNRPQKHERCRNTLVGLLKKKTYLLVFDDFELWLGKDLLVADREMKHFLTHIAGERCDTKILLLVDKRVPSFTSDLDLPFGAIDIHEITGLPLEEGKDLLRASGMKNESDDILEKAVEHFDGNPLELRVFANWVVKHHADPERLLSTSSFQEVMTVALKDLPEDCLSAMKRLAVFRHPVPKQDVEKLDIDPNRHIKPLHDRFLADIQSGFRFVSLTRIAREYILRDATPEKLQQLHITAANIYHLRPLNHFPKQLSDVNPLLEESHHAQLAGEPDRGAKCLVTATGHLLRLGYIDLVKRKINQILPHLDRNSQALSDCYIALGLVYDWQSNYTSATACFNRALTASRSHGNHQATATALFHIGKIQSSRSEFATAIETLQQCLDICHKNNLLEPTAGALLSFGWCKRIQGENPSVVLNLYKKALKAARVAQDIASECKAHRTLGFLLWDAFHDKKAGHFHYDRALALAKKYFLLKESASILTTMGYLYGEWGDPITARKYCKEAIDKCNSIGNVYSLANAYRNYGFTYEIEHKWETALRCYEIARSLYLRTSNESGLAEVLMRIGICRRESSDTQLAMVALTEARDLCKQHELAIIGEKVDKEMIVVGEMIQTAKIDDENRSDVINSINIKEVNIMRDQISAGNKSIINVNSTLTNSPQLIQECPDLTDDTKHELASLIEQLRTAIENIPEEHADDSAIIEEEVNRVVNETVNPDRKPGRLKHFADTLYQAAKRFESIAPKVFWAAQKISEIVGKLI